MEPHWLPNPSALGLAQGCMQRACGLQSCDETGHKSLSTVLPIARSPQEKLTEVPGWRPRSSGCWWECSRKLGSEDFRFPGLCL